MCTARITVSSLAYMPFNPEEWWHITAVGDKDSLQSYKSDDMPYGMLNAFVQRARERSFMDRVTHAMPKVGTLDNLLRLFEYFWERYPDKIKIEVDGDIGSFPSNGEETIY